MQWLTYYAMLKAYISSNYKSWEIVHTISQRTTLEIMITLSHIWIFISKFKQQK